MSTLGACHSAHEEILIAARPATVWQVIFDAPGYERWNPMLVKIEGEFREGEQVKVHLKEPSGKITSFDSTVRRIVPEREIHQGGGFPGLFTFDQTMTLEPEGEATRLTIKEEFRGLGELFIDMSWAGAAYQEMGRAAKTRAEAIEAGKR